MADPQTDGLLPQAVTLTLTCRLRYGDKMLERLFQAKMTGDGECPFAAPSSHVIS